jgi:UDP-glucose 4-epimerase
MGNCLLVGGGGFFGGHLYRRLQGLGHSVAVVDCKPFSASTLWPMGQKADDGCYDASVSTCWADGLYFVEDVSDPAVWQTGVVAELLKYADVVYMLVGLLGSVPCTENMAAAVQRNVLPMGLLIDMLVRIDARPLVIDASSDLVYGMKFGLIREHERKDPMCAYAVTKLAAEDLLAVASRAYHIDSARLRISTTYGPYQQRASLVNFYVRRALDGGELPVYGLGESERDWLYIDDAVDALLLPLTNEHARGAINVPGDQWTIQEVADMVVQTIGNGTVKSVEWPHLTANIDVASHILNGNTIRSYGWDVNVALPHGIRHMAEWMKSQQCTK